MNTLNKYNLNNQLCVISGGAGLLGEKHAEAILDGNGRVVLLDINEQLLNEKVNKLNQTYPDKVWGYKLDITNESEVEKIINKITTEIDNIDILINNAANNPHVKESSENFNRLENFPINQWNQDFAVGLTGAFLLSKYIGPLMAKNKKGVILNIASDLGVIAPDQRIYKKAGVDESKQNVKPVTYSVIKHGIIGLTKYLSTYWATEGVRANSVSFSGVKNNQPDDFIKKLSDLIPMNRMADIDEYKGAILFLCSDASSYMNGSNVIIDGGRTSW